MLERSDYSLSAVMIVMQCYRLGEANPLRLCRSVSTWRRQDHGTRQREILERKRAASPSPTMDGTDGHGNQSSDRHTGRDIRKDGKGLATRPAWKGTIGTTMAVLAADVQTARMPGDPAVTEVLLQAERRADALAEADADALTRLLHPAFRWTSHRGEVFDRQRYMDSNTHGETRLESPNDHRCRGSRRGRHGRAGGHRCR
jgi:hypothetical protein